MIKTTLFAGALLGLMSTGAIAQYYSVPDMSHGYPMGTGTPALSEKDAEGAVVVEDNIAGGIHPHAQLAPVEGAADSAGMTAGAAATAAGQPAAATVAGEAAAGPVEKRDLGVPLQPVEGAPGFVQPYSPGQADPLGAQGGPAAPRAVAP